MDGRVFENFQKNQKIFKFQKCPKSFPKVSKRVLNMFWGNFFEKKFLPSVPWTVESSKTFKKIKKLSKIQKCPKSFPKVSKRVLNMFWGNFFEKKFCPVFHGRSSLRKFSKNQKIFKNPKRPKSFPKVSKRVLNMFWVNFFEKNFCPVFHGRSSLRKFSKKSKNFLERPWNTGQKFFSKKLPQSMFKTRLHTFGNDFGHFWIFESFLIFLKVFEDSTLQGTLGKKFFRKITPNHVQNTFGHFWERF